MNKLIRLLGVSAALFALTCSAFAGGQANQSEGGSVRDNPTLVGGINGQTGKAMFDTRAVKSSESAASVASSVVKAGPGWLFWVFVDNGAGATNYIQVHNATSLPANTAVPLATIGKLAASTAGFIALTPPVYCDTGIVVAKSTTAATLTAGAADATVISAGYR